LDGTLNSTLSCESNQGSCVDKKGFAAIQQS